MPDIGNARRLLEWEPLDDVKTTLVAAMSYYIDHFTADVAQARVS